MHISKDILTTERAFLLSVVFFSTVTSWLLWRWTSPWVQERAFATLINRVSWASTLAVSSSTLMRRDFCSSTRVDSRAVCSCCCCSCCRCSIRTSVQGATGSLEAALLSGLRGVRGVLCGVARRGSSLGAWTDKTGLSSLLLDFLCGSADEGSVMVLFLRALAVVTCRSSSYVAGRA